MGREHRFQWLALGTLLLGFVLACAAQEATEPEPDPEMLMIEDQLAHDAITERFPASLSMRVRIAREVHMLQQEDTATSLKLLSEVEMYLSPGAGYGDGFQIGPRVPFAKEEGTQDVEAVFSNRRVLKVLAECAKLPRKEAGIMVRDELHATLALYRTAFAAKWDHVVRVRQEHPVTGQQAFSAGPGMQLSNNPDGSPTLGGLRYKVLSLLLVAGNLHLTEAEDEVAAATKLALEQREQFYHGKEAIEADRLLTLKMVGIYNRQILAVANYGMGADSFAASDSFEKRRLTTFDAAITHYDTQTPNGLCFTPDYSKGTVEVWLCKPCTDPEFEELLKSIK